MITQSPNLFNQLDEVDKMYLMDVCNMIHRTPELFGGVIRRLIHQFGLSEKDAFDVLKWAEVNRMILLN
jgi:hypothetical protein